jgi:hypothetical protein
MAKLRQAIKDLNVLRFFPDGRRDFSLLEWPHPKTAGAGLHLRACQKHCRPP